jgi:hypothetical protein
MPKAKFTQGSAAEGWPGEALELDFARTGRVVPARRSSPAQRQGAADLQATASAADPYENSCWWILYCMLEV